MERYNTIMKIDEMRRMNEEGQYLKAYEILQTIDTNKIKSLTDFSIIADVYIENDKYVEAKNILLRMYEKKQNRRILYQLVDLCIKQEEIEEAETYLIEYRKISADDSYQFIFRYLIDKLKEESYDVLIESLEGLKEYDYFEMWAYELAKLYHKAGMRDKCINECSDIILWFGTGMYVEKARLLKSFYVGEYNPIQFIHAKNKKDAKERLDLDKTKDYSNIRSEIDRHLKLQEESDRVRDKLRVVEKQEDVERLIPFESRETTSAFDELMSMGMFSETSYEETRTEQSLLSEEYEGVQQEEEQENQEELETLEQSIECEQVQEVEVQEKEKNEQVQEVELQEKEKNEQVQEVVHEEKGSEDEEKYNHEVEVDCKLHSLAREKTYEMETLAEENIMEQVGITRVDEKISLIDEVIDFLEKQERTTLATILGYYYYQEDMGSQLKDCFERILSSMSTSKNFILVGEEKSGRTSLSKLIAKVMAEHNVVKKSKVAKISAEKLNKISLSNRMEVLLDGTLLIEDAHLLEEERRQELVQMIHTYGRRFLVILEMTEEGYSALKGSWNAMSFCFEHKVALPTYTSFDKLGLVLSYVEQQEYTLSKEGRIIIQKALEEIEVGLPREKHLEALFELVESAMSSVSQRNKSLLHNMMELGRFSSTQLLHIEEEDFHKISIN